MLYKKTLLSKRDASQEFSSRRKNNTKNASKFTEVLDEAKEKIHATFTDENIEKVKQKANEAAEQLTDFAEEAQEDIKEASEKVKTIFKKLTKK